MGQDITVARAQDAIPVVQSTADRATRFPTPNDDQRVFNKGTGAFERFSVAKNAWVTDLDAAALGAAYNVRSPAFGAVGDGTTDDSAAISAAITAAAATGGVVFLPPGYTYAHSQSLVVPGGVRLLGGGFANVAGQGSVLKYTGTSGYAVQLGNTAGTLSYSTGLVNLGVTLASSTAHGIRLYGVAHCHLQNLYVQGVVGTTTSVGVTIDGANVSAFFILMQNVECAHVFKGFVHTTTGTTKPTQVLGLNCVAICDNTANSIGIDVQTVGGVGCGDGVTYQGGDMEACATGVKLAGSGTTIVGMRFENTQGVASDITFASTARNNTIVGGSNVYTITDNANSPTNQVIGVPKDETNVVSQVNKVDALQTPASTTTRAGLTVKPGTAPTSPADGDIWTTSAGLFVRINGVTKTVTLT